MIKNRKDLEFYLSEDKKANLKKCSEPEAWIRRLMAQLKYMVGTDGVRAYRYCKALRKYEYALNCLPNNILSNVYRLYCKYRFYRMGAKYNISILPNTIGYGLQINHIIGGGCVIIAEKVGNNFSVRQYTTVGKANGDACPHIGNRVTLGSSVTIIGGIRIGDNSIIGAGSVVVTDIPANSIVVGNPGRVIHQRVPGKKY